jgi:hypothetical protein
MKLDSARSAASASILTIAVTASIQSSTVNSETSALFGRYQEIEGREKSMGRQGGREIERWGDYK